MSKTTITLGHKFEASHHLPDSEGLTTKKCLSNHGHSYGVKVKVFSKKLEDNFVVDFGTIKSTIDVLDHAQLLWYKDTKWLDFYKEFEPEMRLVIVPYPPTAENLGRFIHTKLSEALPSNCTVESVSICEGMAPGKLSWVKYEADS